MLTTRATSLLRHSQWDGLLVALALMHGALLLLVPSVPFVALGLWWNANTISHNFIHLPFFRTRSMNRAFSAYLSLLLGIPQHFWRARHLAHHAGRHSVSGRAALWTTAGMFETALVLALWLALAIEVPDIFFGVYLPGYALGLGLCALQGHFEHARGTTSHYGRLYNTLFFNDGYHVEHHSRPGLHWRKIASQGSGAGVSAFPPVLRWMESPSVLNGLERIVIALPLLQRFMLSSHEQAFRAVLGARGPEGPRLRTPGAINSVTIVGGGLFPRTALIVRKLLPDAMITIVDADARHLERAQKILAADHHIAFVHATFEGTTPDASDLVVIPLAFIGDRARLYAHPPAATVLIHDWWWRPSAETAVVSPLLLKRLNAVHQPAS